MIAAALRQGTRFRIATVMNAAWTSSVHCTIISTSFDVVGRKRDPDMWDTSYGCEIGFEHGDDRVSSARTSERRLRKHFAQLHEAPLRDLLWQVQERKGFSIPRKGKPKPWER